jgi:hypothetical protein
MSEENASSEGKALPVKVPYLLNEPLPVLICRCQQGMNTTSGLAS